MPRGRPKGSSKKRPSKKTYPKVSKTPDVPVEIDPEIEETLEAPQVVEVKHKTEWSEYRPVEETSGDLPLEDADDAQQKRQYTNNAEILRKKLGKAGVLPGSLIKLTIEKYHHSDAIDGAGGHYAEKEHCTKYICSEEHILSEDYLDVCRRFGPGLYRMTIRRKNLIVTAWDKRISGAPSPLEVNTSDPAMPHIPIAGDNKPVAIIDPVENMVKTMQAFQKMRKAIEVDSRGEAPVPPPPAPITDPKIAALQLISENPEIMEKIGSGLAKTVLGAKHIDSDPWAEVAMEAIKSGQAASIVKTAIDSIFQGVNGLFPNRMAQNGQAQMAAPQGAPMENGRVQNPPPQEQVNQSQAFQNSVEGTQQAATLTTEEQALALVMEHCRRRLPVKVAFNRLMNFADAIEESAPAGSIYDYIDLFGKMPVEGALEFVNTVPGGRDVTALDHCKEWTTELQKMIREAEEKEAADES